MNSTHLVAHIHRDSSERDAITRLLERAGYHVIEADEGWTGLDLIRNTHPHLVLLTVTVADLDGIEVCRLIKTDAALNDIKVLLMFPTCPSPADRVRGLHAGADGYLLLPADEAELLAIIQSLFRLYTREADHRRLITSMAQEITERQRVESAWRAEQAQLQRTERQFLDAAAAAHCGAWDWNIATGNLEWFGEHERLTGIRRGSFSEKIEVFNEVLHPADRQRVWRKLEETMSKRDEHFSDEYRFVDADGNEYWMSAVGRFFYDEQGRAVRMTGVIQDVTARKQAEETARIRRERVELLATAAEALRSADDPSAMMQQVFEAVQRHLNLDAYFNYRTDEAGSMLVLEACGGIPEDMRASFAQLEFGQALCGRSAGLLQPVIAERLEESDDAHAAAVKALGIRAYACHPLMVGERLLGTLSFASRSKERFSSDEIEFMRTVCHYVAIAKDRLRLLAVSRHRAERLRESERQLRESKALLDTLLAQAPVGLAFLDTEMRYRVINECLADINGLSVEAHLGKTVGQILPSLEEPARRLFDAVVQTGEPVLDHEIVGETPKRHGLVRSWNESWYPVCSGNHCLGVGVIVQETTEFKRQQDALRESEEFNRTVLENIPDCVTVLDAEGSLLMMNHHGQCIMEVDDFTAIRGLKWWDLWPEGARAQVRAALSRARSGEVGQFETFCPTAKGTAKWWDVRVSPLRDAEGHIRRFVSISRDITEQKRREVNLAFLAEIQGLLSGLTSLDEIQQAMTEKIARHLGLSRCLLVEIDESAQAAEIFCEYHERERASLIGLYRIDDFHTPDERKALTAGIPLVISDVRQAPRSAEAAAQFTSLGIRALVNAPHVSDGRWKFALSAIQDEPRRWRADETDLLCELATRIYLRVERLRAEAALQAKSQQLESLLTSAPLGMAFFDREHRYVHINDELAAINGMTAAAHIGHPFEEILPGIAEAVAPMLNRVFDTGDIVENWEVMGETPREPGIRRHWLTGCYPVRNDRGDIETVGIWVIEISGRKKAEEQVRRSRDAFLNLVRDAPFGVYVIDQDFRIHLVNAGAQAVFTNVRPLIGRDFSEALRIIWPEPFATEAIARFRHTLATGEPYVAPSLTSPRKDSDLVESYEWQIYRIALADGQQGVVCYFYESTEIRRAEQALRESESFYRQVLDSIPGMVFTNLPDGACEYVSDRWVQFTGIPEALQVGSGWVEVLHPDDRERAFSAWRAAVDGGGQYDLEYRVRRHDGEYEWFKVQGRAIRNESGIIVRWFGTALSVDDLKRTEEDLREAERRIRERERFVQSLLNTAPATIYIYDIKLQKSVYTSGNATAALGYSQGEILEMGDNLLPRLMHPDDQIRIQDHFRNLADLPDGQTVEFEYRMRRRIGTWNWFLSRDMVYQRSDDGQVQEILGAATDITARKEAEDRAHQREQQLRLITDSVPSLISYIDPTERYRFVNAGFERMFRRRREDILGLSMEQLLGQSYVTSKQYVMRALAGERVSFESQIVHAGREVTVLVAYIPDMKPDGSVSGFFALATDISDRIRYENELRRLTTDLEQRVSERTHDLVASQDRLRALASQLTLAEQQERRRLAADLHDYLAQLLVFVRIKLGQTARLSLDPVARAHIQDADQVIGQAMTYTRTLVAELSPPALRELGLVAGLNWLAEQMKRHELTVRVQCSTAEPGLSDEVAVLLFQSIRELLINTVKHAECREALVCVEITDGTLAVRVSDAGKGFDQGAALQSSTQDRRSSGFGLFSIRERMESLGGGCRIESSPDRGTTATLTLPLAKMFAEDSAMKPVPGSRQPSTGPKTQMRILLVDPHRMERNKRRDLLSTYPELEVVGEAADGEEALALALRFKPDIILMAVDLPKIDGIEATRIIKQSLPAAIVIGLSMPGIERLNAGMIESGAAACLARDTPVPHIIQSIQTARRELLNRS